MTLAPSGSARSVRKHSLEPDAPVDQRAGLFGAGHKRCQGYLYHGQPTPRLWGLHPGEWSTDSGPGREPEVGTGRSRWAWVLREEITVQCSTKEEQRRRCISRCSSGLSLTLHS